MSLATWDISSAVERILEVAIENGWTDYDVTPDCCCFIKGDHHMTVHIAVNGGIVVIYTDQGRYRGPDRKGWAIKYIEDNS
jgi:hypothetical protein